MKSVIRFRKDSQTRFVKLFSELCNSKSSWEVWADFVAMSAIAILNVFDKQGPTHDAREQEYIRAIQRYTKAEQQIFPKLLAARNFMVREKLAPTSALYVAQDIDRTAALMCYIQLYLWGCAGYVVVADTFRHPLAGYGNPPLLISPTPEQEVWLTPALYDETWCARMQLEKMRLILEHLGKLDFEQKTKPISEDGKETGMSQDKKTRFSINFTEKRV